MNAIDWHGTLEHRYDSSGLHVRTSKIGYYLCIWGVRKFRHRTDWRRWTREYSSEFLSWSRCMWWNVHGKYDGKCDWGSWIECTVQFFNSGIVFTLSLSLSLSWCRSTTTWHTHTHTGTPRPTVFIPKRLTNVVELQKLFVFVWNKTFDLVILWQWNRSRMLFDWSW